MSSGPAIYLDNNATTPLGELVAAAMAECDRAAYANPASSHAAGRRARRGLEDAREEIGRLLGANLSGMSADRVIFTSGGTESNNLAILGLAAASLGWHGPQPVQHENATDRPHAIISAIEHPSVAGPAEHLVKLGWRVDRLPVSGSGVAKVAAVEPLLTAQTRLVSVMLGNNETGVVQPVAEIAALCRSREILVHTDAVQAVGKTPVDFRGLGVDAMTVAAHKFHGPAGIGVLVVRSGVTVEPLHFGGFQQAATRPGTESVTLAVGLREALRIATGELPARTQHLRELRDSFEAALAVGWPGLVVNGRDAERLPHTSNVAFPGLDRQALLMALDLAGVFCSTGSACASGSNEPSPVLLAMGCEEAVVASALRFSFGIQNTPADVAQAASRILKVANDLRTRKKV
jgi:cysteine desulfurase